MKSSIIVNNHGQPLALQAGSPKPVLVITHNQDLLWMLAERLNRGVLIKMDCAVCGQATNRPSVRTAPQVCASRLQALLLHYCGTKSNW